MGEKLVVRHSVKVVGTDSTMAGHLRMQEVLRTAGVPEEAYLATVYNNGRTILIARWNTDAEGEIVTPDDVQKPMGEFGA